MAVNDVNIRIKAIDETRRAFNSVRTSLGGLKNAAFGVRGALAALGTAAVAKSIIDTNVEFQRLEASLKTFTGSASAAKQEFDALSEFAKRTPFELSEVVDAFNILVARGINPSEDALTAFGNIASGTGKSLNQFIEAVADAATGEFERLKEFGIKANKEGNTIKFTFGGVTTAIRNDSEAIKGYLTNLGNTKFAGGMAEQSKTLGGAFSNLRDSVSLLAKAIGDSGLNELIIRITRSMTELINRLTVAVKGKGIFGAIKEILFGSDEQRALESAVSKANTELDRLLGKTAASKRMAGNPVFQQRLDLAVNDVKRAFSEVDRSSMPVIEKTAKIGDSLQKITSATQTGTQELSKLAVVTVGYRDAVASVYAPGIMGKRLTMEEWVNSQIKDQSDALPEVVSSLAVYEQSVKTLGDSLREVGDSGIQAVTDGLTDMITGTKNAADAFRDMASSVIKSLTRMYVESRIVGPLAQMFGIGSFGSQAPAPMRVVNVNGNATGGPVQANRATMVGERGPELFVPNQSGAIIPNNKIGNGSGVTVVQNINVSTGVQQTVRAEVMSLMPQIANAAKSAVADAKLRGGSYAAALR